MNTLKEIWRWFFPGAEGEPEVLVSMPMSQRDIRALGYRRATRRLEDRMPGVLLIVLAAVVPGVVGGQCGILALTILGYLMLFIPLLLLAVFFVMTDRQEKRLADEMLAKYGGAYESNDESTPEGAEAERRAPTT